MKTIGRNRKVFLSAPSDKAFVRNVVYGPSAVAGDYVSVKLVLLDNNSGEK